MSGSQKTKPFRNDTNQKKKSFHGLKLSTELEQYLNTSVLSLIFIHGLGGTAEGTWTCPGHSNPWPKVLLPSKFPDIRILTFGYLAKVANLKDHIPEQRVALYAQALLQTIVNDREDAGIERSIVFVCHSLGGLVCKDALARAHNKLHDGYDEVFKATRGVLFLASPHQGTNIATWVEPLIRFIKIFRETNISILKVLQSDSEVHERINEEFWSLMDTYRDSIHITCFYELLPTRLFGIVSSSSLQLRREAYLYQIVPYESAIRESFDYRGINANHRDIVKFKDESQDGFRSICSAIRESLSRKPASEMLNSYIPRQQSSSHFLGRSEIILRIAAFFKPRKDDESSNRREFLLYGAGGFGKTQICLKFAEVHSRKFWRVFWVDATNQQTLHYSFGMIGQDPDAKRAGVDGSYESVAQWLSPKTQEWLLIFDNADEQKSSLDKWIPPGIRANILISSRNATLRYRIPATQAILVGELSFEHAKELLWSIAICHQHTTLTSDIDQELGNISRDLHAIPLALHHAATAILSGYCELWNYRQRLKEHRKTLLERSPYRGDSGYDQTLYSTWSLTITWIEERALGECNGSQPGEHPTTSATDAIELLGMLAFFHHSSILEDFFSRAAIQINTTSERFKKLPNVRQALPRQFLNLKTEGTWDLTPFREAIKVLQDVSLITEDVIRGSYSIHPLIHAWSRERLAPMEQQNKSLEAKAIMVQAIANGTDKYNSQFNKHLIPHMIAFRVSTEELKLPDTYADDYAASFWRVFSVHGYYREAELYAQKMRDGREHYLGESDPLTLKATETLAFSMKESADPGKLKESLFILKNLYQVREQTLGKAHSDTLGNQILLGAINLYSGELHTAATLLHSAWETAKSQFGKDHSLTIRAATELSSVYIGMAKFREAEELQRQILSFSKSNFGKEHEKTLGIMGALAATLTQNGSLEEAEVFKVHILETRKIQLGEDHPDTLLAQSNLAATYCRQKKWKEAEDVILEVTQKRIELLGEWHRETLRGRVILANCYNGQGRFKEAEIESTKAVTGRTETLGESHPDTLWAMHKLAEALEGQRKIQEAVKLWEKILKMQRINKNLGDGHRETRVVMSKLLEAKKALET